MKSIYLHIGTHKTGSTSIQQWLHDNRSLLLKHNRQVYQGLHRRDNHPELYLAALRYDRDSFGKLKMPEISFDAEYTRSIAQRVQSFIKRSAADNLIFTAEGLSHLRHPDELERLKQVLGNQYDSIRVILVLRDQATYLDRYRKQLLSKRGRKPSKDYWSCLYVEDDTWMTDYRQLQDAYASAFGKDSLHVIDYDREFQTCRNILPAFVRAIGLDPSTLPPDSLTGYRSKASSAKPKGLLARLLGKRPK